jgi:hypothetical protein
MKYVLDSNVALKWVLAEPDSPKANQLRSDFQNGIHDLITPDVFQIEIAHALTRAERQGRIAVSQAGILWADITYTPPGWKLPARCSQERSRFLRLRGSAFTTASSSSAAPAPRRPRFGMGQSARQNRRT